MGKVQELLCYSRAENQLMDAKNRHFKHKKKGKSTVKWILQWASGLAWLTPFPKLKYVDCKVWWNINRLKTMLQFDLMKSFIFDAKLFSTQRKNLSVGRK